MTHCCTNHFAMLLSFLRVVLYNVHGQRNSSICWLRAWLIKMIRLMDLFCQLWYKLLFLILWVQIHRNIYILENNFFLKGTEIILVLNNYFYVAKILCSTLHWCNVMEYCMLRGNKLKVTSIPCYLALYTKMYVNICIYAYCDGIYIFLQIYHSIFSKYNLLILTFYTLLPQNTVAKICHVKIFTFSPYSLIVCVIFMTPSKL